MGASHIVVRVQTRRNCIVNGQAIPSHCVAFDGVALLIVLGARR